MQIFCKDHSSLRFPYKFLKKKILQLNNNKKYIIVILYATFFNQSRTKSVFEYPLINSVNLTFLETDFVVEFGS